MRKLLALVLLALAFGGGFATVWTLTAPLTYADKIAIFEKHARLVQQNTGLGRKG
jgi:hypothetical protein